MVSRVYLTSSHRPVLFHFFLSLALLASFACSSKKRPPAVSSGGKDSGASEEKDAGTIMKPTIDRDAARPVRSKFDAAALLPGEPPEELAGETCAVDTNKLYTLVSNMRQPEPARLAVDLIN